MGAERLLPSAVKKGGGIVLWQAVSFTGVFGVGRTVQAGQAAALLTESGQAIKGLVLNADLARLVAFSLDCLASIW